MYHEPVMLEAAIEGLSLAHDGTYVDATYGGGGHSRVILERLTGGKLIAFDQDEDALANVPDNPHLLFLDQNFRYMKNFLKYHRCIPVDGILADLGVSSHQFDAGERGFSIRFDGPLDMRMNRSAKCTAKQVVNTYDAEKLSHIFFQYGELRMARKAAMAIEKARTLSPIETTGQLADILRPLAPRLKENKFLAQAFQALRIEVNGELDALKALLQQSTEVLREGGRLVVISYHSLEDRLVKHFMRAGNFEGVVEKDFYGNPLCPLKPVGKHQTANAREMENNPRARSARLRVAEKTAVKQADHDREHI